MHYRIWHEIDKRGIKRINDTYSLEIFHQGIKADATQEKHTRVLQVLCNMLEDILNGTFTEIIHIVKYGKENPKWVKDLMLHISKKTRA